MGLDQLLVLAGAVFVGVHGYNLSLFEWDYFCERDYVRLAGAADPGGVACSRREAAFEERLRQAFERGVPLEPHSTWSCARRSASISRSLSTRDGS